MNDASKKKLSEFLTGLDANSRQRAVDFFMSLYDFDANSFPGPKFTQSTIKATARPHVEADVKALVDDLCSGT